MLEGHSVLLLKVHHHLVTEAKQHQLQQREEDVETITGRTIKERGKRDMSGGKEEMMKKNRDAHLFTNIKVSCT